MGNGIDPEEQIDVDMLSATPPYSMAALPPLPEDSRPLGVRRARREDRQMPMRYRDILPHPPPHLPPQEIPNVFVQRPAGMEIPKNCSEMRCLPRSRGNHGVRSPRNSFGLAREYTGHEFPAHDPDGNLTFEDLCNSSIQYEALAQPSNTVSVASCAIESNGAANFFPYPNSSSFRLGNWYWNGGLQKSQADFSKLIDIVGGPDFVPEDVRHVAWNRINSILGDQDHEEGWIDAEDEGWLVTEIKIAVPFHSGAAGSETRSYGGISLYHRSLIAVMKERVSDPHDFQHFHIEPYKYLWKSPLDSNLPEFRVHGELYTSESFLRAHQELQQAPGEPGCQLTRVICAFMFWSDVTHLTAFGDAKVWPCYLYFGNESKYRRGKPTLNSCNHVAYFEKVLGFSSNSFSGRIFDHFCLSFLQRSPILLRSTQEAKVLPRSSIHIVDESSFTNR